MSSIAEARQATQHIYDRIGVRRIINASGATTTVGGTNMVPEALEAFIQASSSFVVVDELNAAVGRKIAEVTGAEAGYVTAGSASGMYLAVAACLTGTDRARAKQLPDTTGMPNELVVHRAHRIGYEQMFRATGGKFVEIGGLSNTAAWELEAAITDQTAAVLYVDSFSVSPTAAIPFDTVVEIAHSRGKPVVVDAASTLPPKSHLTRWIAAGADLAIYSGGKGLRGPQNSGLLAGRQELIDAARLNGSPNAGIGRGMKMSKETIAGLYAAIEWFMNHDHDAEYQERLATANELRAVLEKRTDAYCTMVSDQEVYPAPILGVCPVDKAWSPVDLHSALKAGTPSVHCKPPHEGVDINMHCLFPGEPEIVLERFIEEIDRLTAQRS